MSYGGYPGQQGGPPPTLSPQPGRGPPPGQYYQSPPQGGYPPQATYPPPGHPPPQKNPSGPQQGGYGGPQQGGYSGPQQGGYGGPQQGGYGAPSPQGGYGAPPPHGGYGAPLPQGGYGASPQPGYGAPLPPPGGFGTPPPQSQWGQPPQQYGSNQGSTPGPYGQAPPPTPPYSGSFPPQPYSQAGQFPTAGHPALPSPGYDPHAVLTMDMTLAADKVRAAMKGIGTDDSTLIDVLARLDPLQIAALQKVYTSRIKRELGKDIASETSGHYGDALEAIVQGPLLHDAYCVRKAIKGAGTNEGMLNDVLVGRSNADMRAIKAAYQQIFGKSMETDVRKDVSMKTEEHLRMIMMATRNEESSPAYPEQIEQDVNALHDAIDTGSNILKVCELMTNRSDGQIRALGERYQQRFQTSLDSLIRKKFSGHMEETLLLQLGRATDRAMSDAIQLEETMKGVGTKDDLLVQRVVRAHWNRQHLEQVKRAYERQYRTDLVKRVGGETSGNYKKLLVRCLS